MKKKLITIMLLITITVIFTSCEKTEDQNAAEETETVTDMVKEIVKDDVPRETAVNQAEPTDNENHMTNPDLEISANVKTGIQDLEVSTDSTYPYTAEDMAEDTEINMEITELAEENVEERYGRYVCDTGAIADISAFQGEIPIIDIGFQVGSSELMADFNYAEGKVYHLVMGSETLAVAAFDENGNMQITAQSDEAKPYEGFYELLSN